MLKRAFIFVAVCLFSALIAFVAVCLFSALIAWLGGYDFDSRGFFVAYWAALTVIAAIGVVIAASAFED